MKRAGAILGVVLALGVAVLAAVAASPAASANLAPPVGEATAPLVQADDPSSGKVLIVTAPHLTWHDVVASAPPELVRLFGRSAVASMSVRTIGPRTSPAEGYLSIGAGNRATADQETAGLALDPTAPYEGGTAADAYARRTGRQRPAAAALHLATAGIRSENAALLYDAVPGTLAEAVGARGTAVVANADTSLRSTPSAVHREAALAMMDPFGAVAHGSVRTDLLERAPAAPFGLRLRPDAVDAAVQEALSEAAVVLLELSDLERADLYAEFATPDEQARQRAQAIQWSDELVGRALRHVDLERDLVMVVAPASSRQRPEGLTVAALAGPGVTPGLARSGTTRRGGYVTLADVAPTVLAHLDIDQPSALVGTPITSDGSGSPSLVPVLQDLAGDNEVAVFRDRVTAPASVAFIVFQILVYLFAALALLRHSRRLRLVAAYLSLVTLSVPLVGFLLGAIHLTRLPVSGFVAVLFAAAATVAGVVHVALARRPDLAPLAVVASVFVMLVGDILTGGRLQIDTVFGYSPIVAGRFAGYGNLSFALVATAALITGTAVWRLLSRHGANPSAPSARTRSGAALLAPAAIFLLTVVADGHPAFGSDVGGVLATVPAFAVVLLLLGGVRIGWGRVVALGVGTGLVLAAFGLLDLRRDPTERTHLGRLIARTFDSGGGGFAVVLQRKASANLSILSSSVWTYVIPVAFAFLAFLIWREPRFLRQVLHRIPGLRACLVGAVVAGVLGFALNDSGVAVPAMMLAMLLPYLSHLVVRPAETEFGDST